MQILFFQSFQSNSTRSLLSFEIWIIPEFFPLYSTIAPTHSIIFTTFPVSLYPTSGVQRILEVTPESSIEITTSWSAWIFWIVSPHFPITARILSSGTLEYAYLLLLTEQKLFQILPF